MPLLPQRTNVAKLAEGGKLALGYESQLGATLSRDGVGAAVGDALYQNLPPLAVPFIDTTTPKFDKAAALAEYNADGEEKAGKTREQWQKAKDLVLKDAKITAAAGRKVGEAWDGLMERFAGDLRKDPGFLNNPANRAYYDQLISKTLNLEHMRAYQNSFQAVNDQAKEAEQAGQADYAAYDQNGRRQHRTWRELKQDYLENGDASTDPFSYVFRKGTEKEALANWQSQINTIESSTNGGVDWTNTGVHVQDLRGGDGQKYLVNSTSNVVTTSNAAHVNHLRAKLIGYDVKDKNGKVISHRAGDWTQLVNVEDQHGLLAPRLQALDDAALVPGEKVSLQLTGRDGQPQQLDLTQLGAQQGLTRRQLLQRLDSIVENPQAPTADRQSAQRAIDQLEANARKLADQQITTKLAEHLGLKLQDGTVTHFSQSAAHIAEPKKEKTDEMGSGLFTGYGEGSPGVDKVGESYPVLTPDGRGEPLLDEKGQPQRNAKGQVILQRFNSAAAPFAGSETMTKWADFAVTQSDGKGGRKPKTMDQIEPGNATYLITPQGARVLQGGALGKLPEGNLMQIVGHNNRIVYAPKDPNGGMAEHNRLLQISERVQDDLNRLESSRQQGKITEQQYQASISKLNQAATAAGLRPHIEGTVRISGPALKRLSLLGAGQDEKGAGRLGYYGKDGKPMRPDQFLGVTKNGMFTWANSEQEKLRQMGWTESAPTSDDDHDYDYGKGFLDDREFYQARVLIPVPGFNFNSSSKSEDAALGEAERNRTYEATQSSTTDFKFNNWGK